MQKSGEEREPFRLLPWQSGHPIEVDCAEGMVSVTVGAPGDSRAVLIEQPSDRIAVASAILPPGTIAISETELAALRTLYAVAERHKVGHDAGGELTAACAAVRVAMSSPPADGKGEQG